MGTRGTMIVESEQKLMLFGEKDPAKLPHKANGVEIALECTGFFTDRESAQKHIDAGAKRVLMRAVKSCACTARHFVTADLQ